jgi:hypothetical protein
MRVGTLEDRIRRKREKNIRRNIEFNKRYGKTLQETL